jgi:hypothetical protein
MSGTLVTANVPAYTPAGVVGVSFPVFNLTSVSGTTDITHISLANSANTSAGTFGTTTNSFTGTPQGGTSVPVSIIQPSRLVNRAIKLVP